MVVSGFEWDDDNIFHIESHAFAPEEVEEVFAGNHKIRRTRGKRYIALGETLDGRLAFRRVPAVIRRVRESDHGPGHGGKRTAAISSQIGRPMKKKLPRAKSPLPKFRSNQDAAEYFESHSVASVWDQLPEAPQVKLSAALARKIRDRHARAKSPISLRLAPEQIAAAKHIAAAKSVGYQTQLRMWIAEGIRREAKRA